jgi:hypothetical protein
LFGKRKKWCNECQPAAQAEYKKRWYRKNAKKIKRRQKTCKGCGAQMLQAAPRCGFCEAEDPLLTLTPS